MQDTQVRKFFDMYAERVNRAIQSQPEIDVDGTVAAYTECFIEAHPGGVICFQNDEQFRAAVPQLFESQRNLGALSMTIDQLDLTTLDDYHTMAKVHWNAVYRLKDERTASVTFDEIYFVQSRDGQLRIFAYIAGDQEKLLKENGITAHSG